MRHSAIACITLVFPVAFSPSSITHGVEFGKALDAAFAEFGPAEAVIAHSLGVISTYLTLRFEGRTADAVANMQRMVYDALRRFPYVTLPA